MKRKSTKLVVKRSISPIKFDATEMLLLVFVVVALLMFFSWQQGILPQLMQPAVLGTSASR